mgnify:FL=1
MLFDHHFIGMHWIWWIIVVGIILLVLFNVIPYRPKAELEDDALDILKKRFAQGEIEREEFEERKKILKDN